MSLDLGTLTAQLKLEDAQFKSGIRNAGDSINQLGEQGEEASKKVEESAERTGSAFSSMAKTAGAALAGVGLVAFGQDAIRAASDAEQAVGGVEAVFKSNAETVKAWANESGQALGLASTDYNNLATLIGSQLKNAGTAMEDLAPKTNELIKLGADLAAQFGGSTADAVAAVSSLLKGERDPIEAYGVSMNEAALKAEILAQGLDTSTAAAEKSAEAQATLSLLMKQTADAQGANAREADTAAGQQARAAAAFEESKAAIGAELLPAYQSLLGAVQDLIPVLTEVGKVIGGVVSFVTQLPAPVLAAGAAFAAFLKFGPQLQGFFTKNEAGASKFKSTMLSIGKGLAVGGGLAILTTAIGGIFDELERSKQAAAEFKANLDAIAGTTVEAGGSITEANKRARDEALKSSEAYKGLTAAGLSYSDAYDVLTGKISIATAEQKIFADESNQSGEKLVTATKALSQAQIIASGVAESQAKAQSELNTKIGSEAAEAHREGAAAARDNSSAILSAAEADKRLSDGKSVVAKAYEEASKAALSAHESVERVGQAEFEAAAFAGMLADKEQQHATAVENAQSAVEKAQKAYDDATNALTPMAQAAQDAADAQSELDAATSRIVAQLDKMNGRVPTAEEAFRDLNEATDSFAKGFQDANGNITEFGKGLVNAAGHIDTTTEAGRDLYDGTNKIREASIAAAKAAFDQAGGLKNSEAAQKAAADAARGAYNDYVDTTGAVLGNRDAAKDLGKEYGLLPKDIQTAVRMDAEQAKAQADEVQKKKDALDGATAHLSITAGGDALSQLSSVQSYLDRIDGRTIRYSVEGQTIDFGGGTLAKATGGAIIGPGTGTSDSIPSMLSNGEHVFTASDVVKAGGQGAMYRMRAAIQRGVLKFAGGGAVPSGGVLAGNAPAKFGERLTAVLAGAQEVSDWLAELADTAKDAAEVSRSAHKDLIDAKNDAVKVRQDGRDKVAAAQSDARAKRLDQESKNAEKLAEAEKKLAEARKGGKADQIAKAEAALSKTRTDNDKAWHKVVDDGEKKIAKAVGAQAKANTEADKKQRAAQREYDSASKAAKQAKALSDEQQRVAERQRGNMASLREQARIYDSLTGKIAQNNEKLEQARGIAASQASAVAGGTARLAGGLGAFAEERNTIALVKAGLRSDVDATGAQRSNLAKLRELGYSQEAIMKLGADGNAVTAKLLASGSKKDALEINALLEQTAKNVAAAGKVGTDPKLVAEIGSLTKSLGSYEKQQAAVLKEMQRLGDIVADGMEEGSNRIVGAVKQKVTTGSQQR